MKKIFVSLTVLMLLVGCNDPFDDAMRKGKDALHDKDFETAVKYFERAIIESPHDKDALVLLKAARDAVANKSGSHQEPGFPSLKKHNNDQN